jgi:large subunit ribosomal protein L17
MSRHLIRGRQLSRDTEHRKALRRALAQSLFEHGKIKTTLPKAKEVQRFAEKLITVARRAAMALSDEKGRVVKLNARRKVIAELQDRRLVDKNQDFIAKGAGSRSVIEKLFDEIAPQFVDRVGGYTRIVKLPEWRIGDAGDLVSLELVTLGKPPRGTARRSAGLRRKRAERKRQFANRAIKKADKPAETTPTATA